MKTQLQVIGDALATLQQPENLLQLVVIAGALLLGWWAARFARSHITVSPEPENLPERARELLFVAAPPALTLMILAAVDGLLHASGLQAGMVDVAVQLIGLLLLIRVVIYVLRVSLGTRARLKGWGAAIAGVIWIFLSLHLLGWGDEVIRALDGIGMQAGKTRISVWSVMKLLVTVSVFVLLALWVSRWLERRVLKLDALAPTMRIGIAKFVQAFLVGLSVLVGLNAAGLDLTTLNVLTGAIGIGLGFGLQSIAANFVSGFVLRLGTGAARPLCRRARSRRRRDPGAEPAPDHQPGDQLELHGPARAAEAADPRQLQGRPRSRDATAAAGHGRTSPHPARPCAGRSPDGL